MMDITSTDIIKITVAFLLGAVLGLEREYRSKPAGFRTLIMITVGATLFTILSYRIDPTVPDRIAANIITGIGFIGAGVIFKEGMKVSGMTTAATIWMAAAVGMAVGYGAYYLAAGVTLVMLFTLILLSRFERLFDRMHQVRFYKIKFMSVDLSMTELEQQFKDMAIDFHKDKEIRNRDEITIYYKFSAKKREFETLNDFLMNDPKISGYEV